MIFYAAYFSPELLAILLASLVIYAGIQLMSKGEKQEKLDIKARLNIDSKEFEIEEMLKRLEEENIDKNLNWLERKEQELLQSKTGMSLQTYLLVLIVSMFVIAAVIYNLIGHIWLALIFSLFGILIPEEMLNAKKQKRINLFNKEMVKVLNRMSSIMRAGSSLQLALADITEYRILKDDVREEFKQVYVDVSYGSTPEGALYSLYSRVGSKDVKLLAVTIEVQRQLGGNLADAFADIGKIISERELMEANARAKMAQSKMTATVFTFLPVGMLGIIKLVAPGHFDPFMISGTGRVVFLGCIGAMVFGAYIVKRMSRIDI